jgi:hypothetical protein
LKPRNDPAALANSHEFDSTAVIRRGFAIDPLTDVTDHVEPHKGDMVRFWDASMGQPACAWHHDTIKRLLEQRYAKGEIKRAELWLSN